MLERTLVSGSEICFNPEGDFSGRLLKSSAAFLAGTARWLLEQPEPELALVESPVVFSLLSFPDHTH